ncbi:unnamed protein product [Anisakis simplex]|uniref:Protein timeless homolog (inferred by orthology to a human protein) n=1 Tax=Anisakis simplex TaxID=6269 RepID=A0A0M3JST1_ANISI|nr:unnamed protein product [Anisakis simplex]
MGPTARNLIALFIIFLESIRELIRFLRYDTSSGLARRLCGEHNIVKNDLIPIMKLADVKENLFDAALRLTVNLCQPTITVLRGKKPENKEEWKLFWELEKNLDLAKKAFSDVDFMKILHQRVSSYFESDWCDRSISEKLVVERILVLIEYMLEIGEYEEDPNQNVMMDSYVTDRVIFALLSSGFSDLFVDMATQKSECDFHLLLINIIALTVKHYNTFDILSAGVERSVEKGAKDEEDLRRCIKAESEKVLSTRRRLGVRPTSFAGSYVMKGVKALNPEHDLVTRKVVKDITSGVEHLYERKRKRRHPKSRRMFDGHQRTHSATLDVMLALKQFCDQFLRNAYNQLMNSCTDAALHGRKTLNQRNLDIHYFVVMRFFMEYRRIGSFPTNFVSATLGKEAFHRVQTQLDSYLESAHADRREGRIHGMKAQYAVTAYKELLYTLRSMMESGNDEDKEEVEATCKHIMMVEEYRDLSSSVIRQFMPGILSKVFLRDLILANHTYMIVLEKGVKSGTLAKVMKRQKVRKVRKKRLKDLATFDEGDEVDVDETWEIISEELCDILNGYESACDDVSAIDVRLQVTDDCHKQFAALFIQNALRERRVKDAVGLYRSARLLWPFDHIFGSNEMLSEEEFIGLRMIYFADLEEVKNEWKKVHDDVYGYENEDEGGGSLLFDDELDEDESDDEETTRYITKEIDFSFNEYLSKFARSDILKWYVYLLNDYETNSMEVNKAIIKLLHRIAFDLGQMPRLFQVSLFRIFIRLGEYFCKMPLHVKKEDRLFRVYEFGYHLLKQFFSRYETTGSKLIPELLFWKGPKECYDLEHGYGSYETSINEKERNEVAWTEELSNELHSLYDEYVGCEDKAEGIDVVEFIESNLSRQRTRRQIIRELKSLGLDTFGAKVKDRYGFLWFVSCPILLPTQNHRADAITRKCKSNVFSPDVVSHMKTLVDQFQSMPSDENREDLVDYIRKRLSECYSRAQIIKQLHYDNIEYNRKTVARYLYHISALFYQRIALPRFFCDFWMVKTTSSRRRKPWHEVLTIELRSLAEQYEELIEKPSMRTFIYFLHRLISCSLIDYIKNRLTEKRTISDIRAKLIEMGYEHSKLYSAESSAKVSKPWSELLLIELQSLKAQYNEVDEKPQCNHIYIWNLSDHGIVDYVIARLSEKRSRRDVICKLLEIGVDMSQMKPKRTKKLDKQAQLLEAGSEYNEQICERATSASDSRDSSPSIADDEDSFDKADASSHSEFKIDQEKCIQQSWNSQSIAEASDKPSSRHSLNNVPILIVMKRVKRVFNEQPQLSDEESENGENIDYSNLRLRKRRIVLSDDEAE